MMAIISMLDLITHSADLRYILTQLIPKKYHWMHRWETPLYSNL